MESLSCRSCSHPHPSLLRRSHSIPTPTSHPTRVSFWIHPPHCANPEPTTNRARVWSCGARMERYRTPARWERSAANQSLAAQRDIDAIMGAAEYMENEDIEVARILWEYAYRLTQEMDPSNPRRDFLQYKAGMKRIRMRKRIGRAIDRSMDVDIIKAFYKMFKEKEDIENLDAEEQASQEGVAPVIENSEYQAWRSDKLRRLYAISNILNNVTKSLVGKELEVDSSVDTTVFHSSVEPKQEGKGDMRHYMYWVRYFGYQLEDLMYLHQQLFFIPEEVNSNGDVVVTETTAANVHMLQTMLHDDVERFRNAYTPIDNSGSLSFLYKRFRFNNAPKSGDVPMAKKLLNLCLETIQKSAEHFRREVAGKGYVMNMHQCDLLVERLLWTQHGLENKFLKLRLREFDPILVLRELLQTLLDAQMRIEASCMIRTSQWPRAAFEQGDMKDTFSELLYDVEWHTSLLRSVLSGNAGEFHMKCDGQLQYKTRLLIAVKKDDESLKQRLRSVKVADPIKQELADQFLNQMELPSPDLVFLNPNDFHHGGAGFIGGGGFGAVLKTNFLDSKCAMKVFKGGLGTEVNLALEMNAVKKLGHHPHLVRLFCYSRTDEACYLIMERLQMDLAKVLSLKKKNGHGLSVVEAVDLMLQIGEGLEYIHSKEVAHRDLKPGNILINLADPSSKYLSRICSVKIADFGETKIKEAIITCSHHTKNKGSSAYMAPEVIKLGEDDGGNTRFNPAKADVFSFGIVCSGILTGKTPYGRPVSRQMKEQVKAGTLRPDLPRECPPRLASLIKKCWAGNYDERPASAEICRELRFIKGLLLMYSTWIELGHANL